jgi:heme A synthase
MTFAYMLLAAVFVLIVWAGFAADRDVEESQAVLIIAGSVLLFALVIYFGAWVQHNDEYHADPQEEAQGL